jgi:hypothetical protein
MLKAAAAQVHLPHCELSRRRDFLLIDNSCLRKSEWL